MKNETKDLLERARWLLDDCAANGATKTLDDADVYVIVRHLAAKVKALEQGLECVEGKFGMNDGAKELLERARKAFDRARAENSRICGGFRAEEARWRMSIPVNKERDSDIIFGDAIEAARALADKVEALEQENATLRQDRYDALSVTSKDGLLSSEWVARTGKAERERDEALAKLERVERLVMDTQENTAEMARRIREVIK